MKILLGQKIGMTQMWDDKGRLLAATVIHAEPNKVIKHASKTFLATPIAGKTAKAQQYLAKAINSKKGTWVKEITEVNADSVGVNQFEVGEEVKISGVTKGKGFAGGMKRHGFHGGPKTHGGDNQRGPGSIGAQRPQRVPKGQKMAGHMGSVNFTARGGRVLAVDGEQGLLIISGAIPGANRGKVIVKGVANG